MSLPNLPTDNLYKFMALSGLSLIISMIILFAHENSKLSDRYERFSFDLTQSKIEKETLYCRKIKINEEIEKLEEKVNNYEIDSSILSEKINLKELKESLNDKDHRTYLEFLFKYMDCIIPEKKEAEIIDKKIEELETIEDKLREKDAYIEHYKFFIEINNVLIKRLEWVVFFLIFVGSVVSVKGFSLWYRKVQKYLDIEYRKKGIDLQE
jgi:hypothetical protein